MIEKVTLRYFKKFEQEEFHLTDTLVLAGPNNSGKTTLLQAISAWNLALQRWIFEHAESSKAKQRTGVPISRKDFTAIPLREMNLLWSGRDTAYGKDEKTDVKPGNPKSVEITLHGKDAKDGKDWNLTVSLRYSSKEQIYVKLTDEKGNPVVEVPPAARKLKVVHVPPFSGIGAEETGLQAGYQNLLVGQGKPGDILRNLLLEVYKSKSEYNGQPWKALTEDIRDLFGYELLGPQYAEATDPFIRIEYRDPHITTKKPLDIASAGSGFHQALTLLGFFYGRPASVFLLDEPDAHLHIVLQRQVHDRLRKVAHDRRCQLLISTHSEVLIDDTGADRILSFYGAPHRLELDTHRDQVRESLKRVSSLDILSVESGKNILYLEDESDLKILTEFARKLKHRRKEVLESPFFYAIHGRDVREAKGHLFGLQAIRPEIKGVLLLDGDNRSVPDHDIDTQNLTILRWKRYEIESYLIHPDALSRFVEGPDPDLFTPNRVDAGNEFLRNELPPAVISDPLAEHDYLNSTAASKSLLPTYFEKTDTEISKKDYYQIVPDMRVDEIHGEIKEKLDAITDVLQAVSLRTE